MPMMTAQALRDAETLLAQMRAIAHAAQGLPPAPATDGAAGQGGFAAALARSLDQVSQAQNAANTQAQAFQTGTPGVALNDVMLDLQKASLAFQATVQVRNRLVEAYREIANMAI